MSKKYKSAMDKIVLSDEVKAKIIENAAKASSSARKKTRHTKSIYLRYGIGYVACLLLCFTAVLVSKNFRGTDIYPPVDGTFSYESAVSKATDDANSSQPVYSNLISDDSNTNQNDTRDYLAADAQTLQTDNSDEPILMIPSKNNTPTTSENNSNYFENPSDLSSGFESSDFDASVGSYADKIILSDIRKKLGYSFKIPCYLPEGYEFNSSELMFGSLVQISYLSNSDRIIYRTKKTNEDISGDYNTYDALDTELINNTDTTLKRLGEMFYGAVWIDGDMSYSISSEAGLDKDSIIEMVKSTDYPIKQYENRDEQNITEDTGLTNPSAEYRTEQQAEDYDNNEINKITEQTDITDNIN